MPANDLAAALDAVRRTYANTLAQPPAPQPAALPTFEQRAAIWANQRAGLISIAEAQRRSAAVNADAPDELGLTAPLAPTRFRQRVSLRPRHNRAAPNVSRQYAQAMATTAARDDRLTPNAKAFLQVLAARCGKGRVTTITKGTAGAIMSRSVRTIRRYLVDLIRFGYIEAKTFTNARGLHLGLEVRLSDLVRPFYEEAKGLARWLAETPTAEFMPFKGSVFSGGGRVTKLPSKNQPFKNLSSGSRFREKEGVGLDPPSRF